MKKHLVFVVAIAICLALLAVLWASGSVSQYLASRAYRQEAEVFKATAQAHEAWPELTRVERQNGKLVVTGPGGHPREITLEDGLRQDLQVILGKLQFQATMKIDQDVYFIRSSGYEFMDGIVITNGQGRPTYRYVTKLVPLDAGVYFFVSR